MILKEPENSHVSSFSVNLTDIFKITAKYRPKIILWAFLMFDQIFLSFKFSYVLSLFTWKLEFLSNILWMVAA